MASVQPITPAVPGKNDFLFKWNKTKNPAKRFIVHQLIQRPFETLFGTEIECKWKQVSSLCYSYREALYLLDLLEKSDKFKGSVNNYKIVCVEV